MSSALAVGVTIAVVSAVQVHTSAVQAEQDNLVSEADVIAQQRQATAQAAARSALAVRQQRTQDAAVTLAWNTAQTVAARQLAAAEQAAQDAHGHLDDDLATALTAAVTAVQDANISNEPTPSQIVELSSATAALTSVVTQVAAAHEAWLAEERADAASAAAGSTSSTDCGSAAIREPSTGGSGLWASAPSADGDGSNGHMPRSAMRALGWCVDARGTAQWLRADAAAAMVDLNAAFRAEFGENIAIDLSYRSYADQVRARELYGGLAATPGTSNHGWGTAIDTWEWAAYDFGSARYTWLVANGPAYGWVNPASHESGNPEYWHFDFVG